MNDNFYHVAVIGGGASGMMAAVSAAFNGAKVVLFEKNSMLGRKVRITGKGRCNVTNACNDTVFFENIPRNAKFMYSPYYHFTNEDLQNFFINNGLELKTERGDRVFPKSDKAADVVKIFERLISDLDIKVVYSKIVSIEMISDNSFKLVDKTNTTFSSNSVIIATGGISYPLTGSTGDGYKFAKQFGHTITKLKPSLVPIEILEEYCSELQGLSLKNVALKMHAGDRCVYSDFGEMMFTHFGVTGPIVLSASSHIKNQQKYKIFIDLKPALSHEVLDKRLLRDFNEFINKNFSNSLEMLLPRKIIPVIIKLSEIDPFKKVNSITKQERAKLVNSIKNLPLTVRGLRPISEAIITSGGININEVNPSTMESKICSNLYFCGEVLDVDAYTGGFNLQIAFSTGYLAGEKAAQSTLGGF
ncbi:MAG: NAD(P)/FAD-dependent oxidoreductase [Clostridia bacterium]|nr:NAD(P)/FAD-dependent oxidoreductase [Clostridia bacterium]